MSNEEIVREYRQAKTPLKQIRILADENGCTKREIAEILREAGETLPAQFVKAPPRPNAETERKALEDAGLILPTPVLHDAEIRLSGLCAGRVAVAAVDAIARLLKEHDEFFDETSGDEFAERVRGVLMLAHALMETEEEE